MHKIPIFLVCCLTGLAFANVAMGQSLYQQVMLENEVDPAAQHAAETRAVETGLPVNLYLPEGILIEAARIENGEPVYAVIHNLRNPLEGGELLTFGEIQKRFSLDQARINYGNGTIINPTVGFPKPAKRAAADSLLLLIPESSTDQVMAFDPQTGDLIDAAFIPSASTWLNTPIEAQQTPWNTIVVSDQLGDAVEEFDTAGVHLRLFAPAGGVNTAILDNMRGIAFSPDGYLDVSVGGGTNDDAIARFDTAGAYTGNLVANGAGGMDSPFDVWYRSSDILVPAINSDNIVRYDTAGSFLNEFAPVDNFPEQVVEFPDGRVAVGNFSGSAGDVVVFNANGGFIKAINPPTLGGIRGVWMLGSGNLLITNGGGVHEIDTAGNEIRTVIGSVSARFVSPYSVGGPPPPVPGFGLETGSILFGSLDPGAVASDTVTVSNPGQAELQVDSVFSDHPAFTVTPPEFSVPSGGTADITVTFSETTPGSYSGNIIFTHNAVSSPDTLQVFADVVVGIDNPSTVPVSYKLYRNYPNPFNPVTTIRYDLKQDGSVKLRVFNTLGQEVRTLVNTWQKAGQYEIRMDGTDLASGVYFYRLESGDFVKTLKMLLIK